MLNTQLVRSHDLSKVDTIMTILNNYAFQSDVHSKWKTACKFNLQMVDELNEFINEFICLGLHR